MFSPVLTVLRGGQHRPLGHLLLAPIFSFSVQERFSLARGPPATDYTSQPSLQLGVAK